MIKDVNVQEAVMIRDNIVLNVQDASYLISRENAELFIKAVASSFMKGEEDKPGMGFLQNAIKAFLRMNLTSSLKSRYGDEWHKHLPPPHTDLLDWTMQNMIRDTVIALASKDWNIHAARNGDSHIFQVLGFASVPAGQSPDPAGSAHVAAGSNGTSTADASGTENSRVFTGSLGGSGHDGQRENHLGA